jgi:hypothetical protein
MNIFITIDGTIRHMIFKKTKAYKVWLKDARNTESFKQWISSGGKSYSETHDIMVNEICSLPSYKKYWRLKEYYPFEKMDYLKQGDINYE